MNKHWIKQVIVGKEVIKQPEINWLTLSILLDIMFRFIVIRTENLLHKYVISDLIFCNLYI